MKKLEKVIIMAGGTGGHVFPGLALAKLLRDRGVEVHWLGTQNSFEDKIVPEAGFPLHYISIGRFRGRGLKDVLLMPFRLLNAMRQSFRIIRQVQPDIVIGMGGFVSGPGGIAAWILRKPLIVHEQNARAGMTNHYLSYLAKRVLEGFPGTFAENAKVIATGNPLRKEITLLEHPNKRFAKHEPPLRLLVLGGSLGALAINTLVPQALQRLFDEERPSVYHQTGDKFLEETKKAYENAGIKAQIVPFIENMQEAYASADLVICRAGALTISELCAVGLPSILIPFPHAVDDHQTANASYLVKNAAGILIQQADLSAEDLAKTIREFLRSPERRLEMAEAAFRLRKTDASEKVYQICEEICQ